MILRILAPVVSAWAAALLLINLGGGRSAWPLALGGWAAAACTLVLAVLLARHARLRSALALVAVCLCCAAMVGTTAAAQQPLRQPSAMLAAAQGGRPVTVHGTVLTTPLWQNSPLGFDSAPRVRLTVRVDRVSADRVSVDRVSADRVSVDRVSADRVRSGRERIGGEGIPSRLSVPVQVFAGAPVGHELAIGSRVVLTGRLQANAAGEPHAFRLFAEGALQLEALPPWYLAWAANLRAEFREAAGHLPGDGGALLPGLAIGDTGAVGAELDSAMKASALSHLTAVSGANCAVVVAAVMLLTAALGVHRRWRVGLSLASLLAFVVLVTPEPSVLRAGVMALIVLIGLASGRPGGGVPALGLAVLALLALDPWLAASYGFALSVLATAGLLLLTAPLGALLARWMPRWLALALALPLAAQLACQPVLIALDPTLSLLGVPANLLAGPVAPAATLLGLLSCMLTPVLPSLGFAIAQLAWLPAAWIAAVARTVAGIPGSRLPWLDGLLGALLLAAATALALLLLLGRRRRATAPVALGWAVLLVVAGVYGGTLLGTGVVRTLGRPGDWQIALCDVGQGDATLLRDGDRVALVDTGPDPAALSACLGTLGVGQIELLVLTHYDRDHVGGLPAVTGRVDAALVGRPAGAADERVVAPLLAAGTAVRVAARGDRGALGGLDWRVLWPAHDEGELSVGNPGSVVLQTEGGGIRSVFLGDLGEESELALQRLQRPGRADVVKVAHHGSSDQDAGLYRALGARVGLIGVGAGNGYGHPTAAMLGILEHSGTRALRSDLHGLVLVAAGEGGALRVWTERNTAGVAPVSDGGG